MLVKEFLKYLCSERNYSERTVGEYGEDLQKFESFFKGLDATLTWETVDSDVIRDWMESMMDEGNVATSVNRRLSAVRSFYRFALSRGFVAADPSYGVRGPKKEKPLPQFVKEADMDRLLDESMWNMDRYEDVRARTIISVIYETGVRIAELLSLDDAAVDMSACQLKVTGKGDKQRIVPFGSELRDVLLTYINMRDAAVERKSPAFFLSSGGLRMNYYSVRREIARRLSSVCTLKKRSPHVLRHTFATAILRLIGKRFYDTNAPPYETSYLIYC